MSNDVSGIQMKCSRIECSGISFTSSDNLKKHLKQHLSKRQDIMCPYENCSSSFKVKSTFTSHLTRKHKIGVQNLPLAGLNAENNVLSTSEETELTENPFHGPLYEDVQEFDFEDSEETEKQFLENLALFYLKLQGKYLLPVSTIQALITELDECHATSQTILIDKVCKKMKMFDISEEIIDHVKQEMTANDLFANCNKGPLKTAAKRASFFRKHFPYCEPVEVFIGYDSNMNPKTYQYIPICQSIASLYQHFPSHFDFFQNVDDAHHSEYLEDVTDGSAFKQSPLYSERKTFRIILYQDAFEVVNPLGSAKKKHKLIGVYYTLANFAAEKRSNIDHMQLILLCKESDLKSTSSNAVFERLVKDLKLLETDGITVNGETIKGSLFCIAGDNLGSHMIGGFVESFSANFFCRYCEFNRRESGSLKIRSIPRTVESYKECIDTVTLLENDDSVKGLKLDSPFNSLSSYHVASPGLPPCLGHDLFEGVVSFDMALIVNHLIELEWFTCEALNHRIATWPYSGCDSLDKPAPFSTRAEKLSGHAVQNWVFLRMFVLFVGHFVKDAEHRVWQMYLNLKAIVESLCSTRISLSQVAVVNMSIEEYMFDREELFPEKTLKPKHHFLVHYPELTLAFGPLIHLWTMRFESKHTYFKRCARQLHNYKHLSKTLAQRHQLLQAYYTRGSLFQRLLLVKDTAFPLHKSVYNASICELIDTQEMSEKNTLVSGHIVYKNISYKVGNSVLISENDEENVLTIGTIQLILMKDGGVMFVVILKQFVHIPGLGLYRQVQQVDLSPEVYQCVDVLRLKCSVPICLYEVNHNWVVSLKSSYN